MEVESYKKKRNNLYEVSFDNGEKYALYDDIILKYELLIEKKIDKKKLENILEDNSELDAYYRALKYINLRMRTKYELKKYLNNAEFEKRSIDYAIKRLEAEGYIDEKAYVQAYINDSLNLGLNGPRKIQDNLKKLGIDEKICEDYLSRIDDDTWLERIKKIIDKKAKTNKVGLALFKNKMYSEIAIMGYYTEDIRKILEGYTLDTKDVFTKEADKVYNKLSLKYRDSELILRFKNKMYLKGFDVDSINEYINKKG